MSRSYKKHGHDSICSSRGDKYCRSHYHRSDRRKTKKILEEVTRQWVEIPYSIEGETDNPNFGVRSSDFDWVNCWEETADKLITKGEDYSLYYADKWAWASDGGAYFQGDLSTAHQDFDKCCLGIHTAGSHRNPPLRDFYNDYCRNRDAKHNKDKKSYRIYVNYRVPVPAGRYNCGTSKWLENVIGQHKNRKSGLSICFEKEYDFYRIDFTIPFTNKPLKVPNWVYEKVAKAGGEITQISKSIVHPYGRRTTSIWGVDDYTLSQNIIPDTIQNSKDLRDYLIAHREEICKGWLRRRFGK